MISKLLTQIKKHKFITVIIFLFIAGGGYFSYLKIFSSDNVIRYAVTKVQKGTLVVSVTGSGQVSASNQVDIKPKVSGDVVYIGAINGQEVKTGDLIVQLDIRDAQKIVRDAEINLESARLSLNKFKLDQERQLNTLNKSYEKGMDILADFYDKLPIILDNLKSIYFQTNLSSLLYQSSDCNVDYLLLNDCNITYYAHYGENEKKFDLAPNQAAKLYREINELYNKSKLDYQNTQRSGDNKKRLLAIEQGREIAVKTAEMIKIGRDVISSFQDIQRKSGGIFNKQNIVDEHISSLTNFSDKIAAYTDNLLSVINSIKEDINFIDNLALDLQTQELFVKQKENALLDAKEKLADYYIRAPFNGIIAKMNVKNGDPVTSANVLAALITRQKIAEISLNEVDITKIKIGQKATLTFEAIPNFVITGKVVEIDAVGTVSQGVVTYNVKIAFDTQDKRVKPAMSVSASIIIEAKPNVILVPNSAVKSQGEINYVEFIEGDDRNAVLETNKSGVILKNSPRRQPVEIGGANDEFTEIVSGLKEGDIIITRIIQPTATQNTQTQQQSSGLRIPGFPGGGSSGFRSGSIR